MAAYAALTSLMNIIHDIQHHHSPPISIHIQQAQSLTQTITSLQQFLETHNTSSVSEIDEADPLEMRIADAAYAVEDIIESHIVNRILPAGSQQPRNGIVRFFNCFRALKKPENIPFFEVAAHRDDETKLYDDLQRVIEEMESIKKLTAEIDAEKPVVHHQRLRSVDAERAPSRTLSTRHNNITVCSDDVINEVMEKLGTGRLDRHIISIVGMGGIGKTTLAGNVYGQPFIKEHFDIRAWVTISQKYNSTGILCEIISQATKTEMEKLREMSEDDVGTELYKYLFGRRYLIVMDDMWSIAAWDRIQRFFPNNKNGSRILVTTRLSQLSSQLNEHYSLHMKFLDKANSWDLFLKTVFGELKSCPRELEEIGKKIVYNCRGLPLSIVVVGGILKKMEYTRGCWESIGNNLSSLVNLENDKHCLRLLSLSYSHLPAYLKPCFLYMGVFEEDSVIKVSKLIKLWTGEGFLKPTSDESLKAIGKGLLKDLVDRNLILVHKLGATGNVKYCKIHDLLRDLCLCEGKKGGFYHVIGQESPQGVSRQRRVVIPRNTSKKKVFHDLRSMPHVRSVISEYGKVPSYRSFKLVRVLHEFKYPSKRNMKSGAFQYVNLRHLAVEVRTVSSLFSSITLQWNLHTLILKCSQIVCTAPAGIWKMPQFRHIEFVGYSSFFPNPPSDAVIMENLHILKNVVHFKLGDHVVERIPNIQKVAVHYYFYKWIKHEDYYRLNNIHRLHKLESLRISCWLSDDFRKVESLNKLTFPHSLKKLYLSMILKFECNDILEKIASLPLLEKLTLRDVGFRRGEWEIAEGQFPCLKYLEIKSCSTLRKLTAQDQSSIIFPRLEVLNLGYLEEMEEIPSEIGEIATLQKVWITKCGASMVKCAKVIVEEQVDLHGEEQVFHVVVSLWRENAELQSLAAPNFQVFVRFS